MSTRIAARGMATKVQRSLSGSYRNSRWPSEAATRRPTSVPSAEQRGRWKEQRAGWQLANAGDNWYAAERRLWKLQMTELRREWELDALSRRREEYVQRREAARQMQAAKDARAHEKSMREAERVKEGPSDEELAHQAELHRKHQERQTQWRDSLLRKRDDAEKEYRRKWLEKMMAEYDLEGGEKTGMRSIGKRALLSPENLDKRLQIILMNTQSPIAKWNGLARKHQMTEEELILAERTGGRVLDNEPAEPYDDPAAVAEVAKLLSGFTSLRDTKPAADAPAAEGKEQLSESDEQMLSQLRELMGDLKAPSAPDKPDKPKE